MSVYPRVSTWHVPSELLLESLSEMRIDGKQGNEGVCLWLGIRDEDKETAMISHVVRLRGSGIEKKPAQIQIAPELMREVHEVARGLDRILVGQIHSHGKAFGVKLSYVDVQYGIAVPYYLSVVAPEYALKPQTEWRHCGAHVYFPKRGYVRVAANKIINVDPALPLAALTIGDEQ